MRDEGAGYGRYHENTDILLYMPGSKIGMIVETNIATAQG